MRPFLLRGYPSAPFASALLLLLAGLILTTGSPAAAQFTFSKVVMHGQSAPGNNGTFDTFLGQFALSDRGTLAFISTLGGTATSAGLFTADTNGTNLFQTIATVGQSTTVGAINRFSTLTDQSVDINNAGLVAFRAELNTGTKVGIFTSDGTLLTPVAVQGDPAPGGGTFSALGNPTINVHGTVAFTAGAAVSGGGTTGVYTYPNGVGNQLASTGDPVPGGHVTFISAGKRATINDNGNVAYIGVLNGDPVFDAVFTAGATISRIAMTNDSAPGGKIGHPGVPDFNNRGGVVFQTTLGSGTAVLTGDANNGLTPVVVTGQSVPSGGTFDEIRGKFPVLNERGDVAFAADVSGTINAGIFFWQNAVIAQVAAVGQSLFGSTLTAVFNPAMNDGGQIAFQYTLANGENGIALATGPGGSQPYPTPPHHGTSFNVYSGRWDDPDLAFGYDFVTTDGSRFTDILNFPTGFVGPFTVSVGGIPIGQFTPGQSVRFVELFTGGVSSFRLTGIQPPVNASDGLAFPIQLAFDHLTASFDMIPLTAAGADAPEPASLALFIAAVLPVGMVGAALAIIRPRRTACKGEYSLHRIR